MRVPKRPLNLTKVQAAVRQSEAAIRALKRGDFDIVVTLACAAEGMLKTDQLHLFQLLKDHPRVQKYPRKQWITYLNEERDWLKHPSGTQTMTLDCFSAVVAISRALSKIGKEHWTALMEEFLEWHRAYLEEVNAKK